MPWPLPRKQLSQSNTSKWVNWLHVTHKLVSLKICTLCFPTTSTEQDKGQSGSEGSFHLPKVDNDRRIVALITTYHCQQHTWVISQNMIVSEETSHERVIESLSDAIYIKDKKRKLS